MEPIQLQLTEVESNLRRLLLDVATYIDSTSSEDSITSVQVPDEVAKENIVLRWTGGWVRDKLLNVESHDIDLAINNMTGEHFGLKMQDYLRIPGNAEKYGLTGKSDSPSAKDQVKNIAPGLHKIEANPEKSKNLETATTRIMGIDLDLVNLRKETYNEVSRNPQMEFGTAEEDAMRRDATVNAMFFNLHTCQVEDFTERGHEDMAAGIIRTPLEPYQTFKDDPLRVLRLIRFASRLHYTIEPETAKAMGNPEIQDVLKIKISRERVGIELEKMLKGPRPHLALELINRFGLYKTVFTDPTRDLPCEPETAYFQPAYNFIQSFVTRSDEIPPTIPDNLLRSEDEKYLAWVCSAVMPWADAPMVPHPKPTQRPLFAAYLVAREGFKAPNKVCDVMAASLSNSEEIRNHVSQCARGLRRPDKLDPANNFTGRDTLGMAIRRWGPTWRTQLIFNLLYEVVLNSVSKKDLLASYAAFVDRLLELKVHDADTLKPLLKGTDLAKALNTKPGPWMKDALEVVMAWQLRNPEASDPAGAIEAVRASRATKTESELSSRLASHFLQLTIPPFFPQNKQKPNALENSRQPAPWRDEKNGHVLDLLKWTIAVLSPKEIETQWRFLMPPILQMIDVSELEWKAEGCRLLALLLEQMQAPISSDPPQSSTTTANFLQRTGYHNLLTDTLFPLFMYLPTLTPEPVSETLLSAAYPPLLLLAPSSPSQTPYLTALLRTTIITPLYHLASPTPTSYPSLTTSLLSLLPPLLSSLGINSVRHLQRLIPLLTSYLQDPFALLHRPLLPATLTALRALMQNSWPRIHRYRQTIAQGLCALWLRYYHDTTTAPAPTDAESTPTPTTPDDLPSQLKETGAMLDAILRVSEVARAWAEEKEALRGVDDAFAALLGGRGA